MSRSGYTDDADEYLGLWRGAVASAIRGKRGQSLLREVLSALDSLTHKRLIAGDLVTGEGEVCALGAVGVKRGVSMLDVDPEDTEQVSDAFGIANALACEIMYVNDELGPHNETPELRFSRVRTWVARHVDFSHA